MAIFCFTDIEGSTQRWEQHPDVMGLIITRHNAILQQQVAKYGGEIIKFTGDGMFAVFKLESEAGARTALECGVEIQKAMQAEPWPAIGELRVRMAFHCGEATEIAGDYFGPVANRTARLMALGWGGQILVSEELKNKGELPPGAQLSDLGVHQVKDLPEPQQVYGLIHPALSLREFPALRSLSSHPNNLPTQLAPFIGRQEELDAIAELLLKANHRLFSLVGPGGIGKTRLAIQAGALNLARFQHGVYFVNLAPLHAQEQIVHNIGAAIKLRFYQSEDPKIQLLNYLQGKQLLLILDNFEHLIASAGLVTDILESAPEVRILVTSRERLNLSAEWVVGILGLTYPSAGDEDETQELGSYSAIQLFVSHAQRVKPGFTLKPEERAPLIKVCGMIAGMPLGLELAAAWARMFSVKAISERVEKDIAFLAGSERDLPERQRSIRAVFNYSWELLTDDERRVFSCLSVFRAGFDLEAAEFVAQGSLAALSGLVDKSLLFAGPGGRYSLHEAVRQFASEKLEQVPGEKDESLCRHAEYYCEFMSQMERHMRGYRQAQGFLRIREEFENVRLAWQVAVTRRMIREIAKAATCLGVYLVTQGLGRQQAETIDVALKLWQAGDGTEIFTDRSPESMKAYASLLLRQAFFNHSSRSSVAPSSLAAKACAILRQLADKTALADALVLSSVFDSEGPEHKIRFCREAIALYQEVGDHNGEAWGKENLAAALLVSGQLAEAERGLLECLPVFQELGNDREQAWTLVSLGRLAKGVGRLEEAAQRLTSAVNLFEELGDFNAVVIVLGMIGQDAIDRKDWDAARKVFERELALFRAMGYSEGIKSTLRSLEQVDAANHAHPRNS